MVADESVPAFRLDGAQRRSVAVELWNKWRAEGYGSVLLFGISGVGKSEGIVHPLRDWADGQKIPTVWVDVPADTVSFDSLLLNAIVQELGNGGHAPLVAHADSLASVLRTLLRAGALVILDEFQRALEPNGGPLASLARMLEDLARRPADTGCLLLVSNRHVDWSWTESFHVAELPPPNADADAVQIVLQQLNPEEEAAQFPDHRRLEVVHRVGRNPRVLRLLGLLLRSSHVLGELLPPVQTDLTEPVDPQLVDGIELKLLAKAAEGLPEATRAFLRDMSVLREWADWSLIEAMADQEADVRNLVREGRQRFLLQVRASTDPGSVGPGGRYKVHPLLREVGTVQMRRDGAAWRAANRRAGEWYARKLGAAGRAAVHGHTLQVGLDGSSYHLAAAGAEAELRAVIEPVQRFLNQQYGWSAKPARTSGERDARIALLELYNGLWGTAGTNYHLARLLWERGGPGDFEQAKQYARQATEDQTHADPWRVWIQLVRAVDGLEAGVAAAREGVARVAPTAALYAVYLLLGAFLDLMGRTVEAVTALREGIGRSRGNEHRLASLAAFFAAAQPTEDLLEEVCDWLSSSPQLKPQHALARALLLERRNRWADALPLLVDARRQGTPYVDLALHEALCYLALGNAAAAQETLSGATYRLQKLSATAWCAAFVALELGRTARSAELLRVYLGDEEPHSTADGLRMRLLYEWDMTVGQLGIGTPSLMFPVLPPALSGLSVATLRSQHGGPTLPQHQAVSPASAADRPNVLALITAWSPTSGGVNSFNRQLCISLAATAQVTCVVLEATDEERRQAADANVALIEAPRSPGASDTDRLSYRPQLPDGVSPDIIIGHGRWTGPAARRLTADYPNAKRLHVLHVVPEDIERYKPKEGVDAAALAEERQEIDLALSAEANYAVAVGPRIYNWFHWDLERRGLDVAKLIRFDPGFDSDDATLRQPPQRRITVLVTGRMEDYRLKGLDLAARAFNEARLRRRPGSPPVELLVRGAPPEKSTVLENQMREWARDPSLPVRAQPYTTKADRLTADLRGASLVLMSSRAEGFGLVAAEAIAAGTPVLMSSESGIGELLEGLEPEEAGRIVVAVTGDDDRDVTAWSNVIDSALRDRDAEFRRVAALRGRLAARLTWSGAAVELLKQVCGAGDDPISEPSPSPK
ncbi:glycosyltransferase [Actinoplanes sp. NPDC048967]|uniref:glycosyltransferase n=1 Tax=Actinoplanes sp. NPDC048967 TaxID=3155269 RepID=UPI00340CD0FC